MINFIKNREKKYYKKLFEKRFKEIPNISTEKSSSEFFIILINEIYTKYQIEIRQNDETVKYLEKEKIRLRAKIELLKSQDYNIVFKYMSALYSLIVPIIVSAIGFLLFSSKNVVDLAVQNTVEQLKSNNITNVNEVYNSLLNIYSDFNIGSMELIAKIVVGGILGIGILFVFFVIQENNTFENNNRIIVFESMCLDILDNLEL